jgi:hypothetical protein
MNAATALMPPPFSFAYAGAEKSLGAARRNACATCFGYNYGKVIR